MTYRHVQYVTHCSKLTQFSLTDMIACYRSGIHCYFEVGRRGRRWSDLLFDVGEVVVSRVLPVLYQLLTAEGNKNGNEGGLVVSCGLYEGFG